MTPRQRLSRAAATFGERAVQWVTHAVEHRLDAARFYVAEQTPYEVIDGDGLYSVRAYPPLSEDSILVGDETRPVRRQAHAVPVVLVPPLAASSLIFDLLPTRSLVKFLLAEGFRVYLVDWGDPEADHAHLALRHYTTEMLPAALKTVREHSGSEELSLLGYCMGGLFSLIYAGWSNDPKLRNIVTIASPIDYHQIGIAGDLLRNLNAPARLIRKLTPFRIDRINPRFLRVPGRVSSLVFKLTNPLGTLQAYADLMMNLWDREFVTEHTTTAAWFDRMYDYPGGVVQDFIVRVGLDNQMARGRLRLGRDRESLFNGIDADLLAIAGDTDRIVTVSAARRVLDVVASGDRRFEIMPGGHAGVFGGSRAPATTWRTAADWLAERSAPSPGKSRQTTAGKTRSASVARKPAKARPKRRGASKGIA